MGRAEFVLENAVGKTLDVGYACGTLHERLIGKLGKKNVYGIDIEDREKDERHKIGSAEKIPFEGDFFDCIAAGELIEHLKEPKNFLAEAKRVLKKNGLLILTTPNRNSLVNRAFHSYETKVHLSLFTEKEMREILESNGFEVKAIKYFPYTGESSYGSRRKWSYALREIVHHILPDSLRENMAVLAAKK